MIKGVINNGFQSDLSNENFIAAILPKINTAISADDASDKSDPTDSCKQYGSCGMWQGGPFCYVSKKLSHVGHHAMHNEYMWRYRVEIKILVGITFLRKIQITFFIAPMSWKWSIVG